MRMFDVISKKKYGEVLSKEEIEIYLKTGKMPNEKCL